MSDTEYFLMLAAECEEEGDTQKAEMFFGFAEEAEELEVSFREQKGV